MGTPEQAVPSLQRLARHEDIGLVITRPDRPSGRGRQARPSPVATAAARMGIPTVKTESRQQLLDAIDGRWELGVVVAFGMLIPETLLERVSLGFVNLHFSLLPRWRGAAPVRRALLAGDQITGVTVFKLVEELDAGPILASAQVEIGPAERATELTDRLATLGAAVLAETVHAYRLGQISPRAQPEAGATLAPKLDKDDQRIRVAASAGEWVRRVKAMGLTPGAFALLDGERFKVLAARNAIKAQPLPPGELAMQGGRLLCGTGRGVVELLEVQLPGRSIMTGAAWARGRRHPLGTLT